MDEASKISAFYDGRCVLITGSTGFMGKVLVEKLLSSCTGIRTIYMLIRPKQGKDIRQRVNELLASKIFERVQRERPEVCSKLHPVLGDITSPELGMSEDDARLLAAEVSVVFHAAATVKFDEPLKFSVNMNILGTKRLLELCRRMSRLVAFVHVSTAYCNCDRFENEEMVYPASVDPDKLAQAVEWMDETTVEALTPKLLQNRPNTYTFTKALAEHVLLKEEGKLPLAIVRPSIVTAAWKEPLPGWIDNLNGPTGLIVGAGKGVLKSLLCYRHLVADLVPVDVCINLMIAVAWRTADEQPGRRILVFNCSSGTTNPIRWGEIEVFGKTALLRNPFENARSLPGGCFYSSELVNTVFSFLYHTVPAYVVDGVRLLLRKKLFAVRLQKKFCRSIQCLRYFTTHQWRFPCGNIRDLLDRMSPCDRELFCFDLRDLNWPSYLENYCLGVREYVLGEHPRTLPAARRHLRYLQCLRLLFYALLLFLVLRFFVVRSEVFDRVWKPLASHMVFASSIWRE